VELKQQIGRLKGAIRADLGITNKFCGLVGFLDRRELVMPGTSPLVSFTFDDFPRSALTTGGEVLNEFRLRATYYAASGLMDGEGELGCYYRQEDLKDLLAEGHELGSHTHSHVSSRSLPPADFEADVARANALIERFSGTGARPNFSYPFGEVALASKGRIGRLHASCRTSYYGINYGTIDLNLLRANPLYSSRTRLEEIGRLLEVNVRRLGWLILYTHDVCQRPSPYGCTPDFLRAVLQQGVKSGARILTLSAALEELGSRRAWTVLADDRGA